MPRRMLTMEERLLRSSIPEPNCGCWIWLGDLSEQGYPHMSWHGKTSNAHRVVYEHYKGKIPAGLQLDHLCRMRCCVNPEHLEPVTGKENVRRGTLPEVARARILAKTHCPHGHPYSGDNLAFDRSMNNARRCRICLKIKNKKGLAKYHERKSQRRTVDA